jgi:hypothetical protein
MADADDEGITARPGFGQDLHGLTVAEAELEQAAIECRQDPGTRAHADDHASGSRRQGTQTHVSGLESDTARCDDCIHGRSI